MRLCLLLPLLPLLAACTTGPSAGDVFEDPMSRERVRVLFAADCTAVREGVQRLGLTIGTYGDGGSAYDFSPDIVARCVAFDEGRPGNHRITIETADRFAERRWVKVN